MSIRVKRRDVELIIDTSVGDAGINAFIADASLWVDTNLVDESLGASLLKAIEKYLAAYFISLRDPRLTKAKFEGVDETYQRDPKENGYLRAAIALDPSGKIADQFTAGSPNLSFRIGAGFDSELSIPSGSS